MKNNFKIKFLFAFIICTLLSACYSTKISISPYEEEFGLSSINYFNFDSAILMADPSYIDSNMVSPREQELANSLRKIVNNDFESAVPDLWKIFNKSSTTDTTNIRYFAYQYLYGYYRLVNRMDSCLLMNYLYSSNTSNDSLISVVHNNYIKKHPESVLMLKDIDTLPLIENSTGHPLTEIEINGKKFKFIFDTGAMVTIVDGELAKECNLQSITSQEMTLGTSNELNLQTKDAYCTEIKFGSVFLKNQHVFISEYEDMDFKFLWFFTLLECDGLIGWPILKNFDITFDFDSSRIIIRKPQKRKIDKQNMFWLLHPVIKLKTKDGIPLNAYFDSGSNSTCFTELIKQKIPAKELNWNFDFSSGLAGGLFHIYDIYPEIDLFTNGKKINFRDVDIIKNNNLVVMFDLVLGSDLGKKGKIRIDALNGYFDVDNANQSR